MIMECICEGDEFCFGWDQKRDITNYTILLTARAILTSVSIPIGIIIFMSSIPWVERNQIDLLLGQGYRLESGLAEMLAGLDNPIILSREQVDEYQKRFLEECRFIWSKDERVDWDDMKRLTGRQTGVLRQNLHTLQGLESWIRITFKGSIFEYSSYRNLYWQDYVMGYVPALGKSPMDLWVLAELFSYRELVSEYLKIPMERDDLDAYLDFSPFLAGGNMRTYRRAVREREVSEIKMDEVMYRDPDGLREVNRYGIAGFLVGLWRTEYPHSPQIQDELKHKLPTANLETLRKYELSLGVDIFAEKIEGDISDSGL